MRPIRCIRPDVYDYLSAYSGERHRLYLTPLMMLESDRLGYRMIEMRRSIQRPCPEWAGSRILGGRALLTQHR